IPSIRFNPVNDKITTPDNEEISLFINHIPASEMEIQGLRGQNISRVEVIDYPTDPRFRNKRYVINIILKEQNFGGYTKFRDRQDLFTSSDNSGSVFSRFSYKKMTYDAYVGLTYSNTNHQTGSSTSRFKLRDGEVERIEDKDHAKNISRTLPISLQATYNTDYSQIVNTIGFGLSNSIRTDKSGRLHFIPTDAAREYSFNSVGSGRSKFITYSGVYFFYLPHDWSFSFYPYFSYSNSKSTSGYSTDMPQFTPIINNVHSRATTVSTYLSATKTIGAHSLYFTAFLGDDNTLADYSGTTLYGAHVNNLNYSLDIAYQWNIPGGMRLVANFIGEGYRQKSNGAVNTSPFQPSGSLSFSRNLNSKSRISIFGEVKRIYSGYSSASDVEIRMNEFMYSKGNPDLKPYHRLTLLAKYNYLPLKNLDLSAFVKYNRGYDVACVTYLPNEAGTGIVSSNANIGGYQTLSAGTDLSARLFSNHLTIQASVNYEHNNVDDFFRIVYNQVTYSLSAYAHAGDFNFSASVNPYHWTINPIGGIRDTNSTFYQVGVNWSNDAWIVDLKVRNFFRYNYFGQTTRIDTPDFSTLNHIDIPAYHAGISLSVVYSFGYGKKVSHRNELGAQSGVSSSVISGN
ncbi:MAG: outer membrane beta-barrel family protein, partial [Muribaculaceae bacterium]|nr:outer membrane beta-barrel family protein [Muribaculaceae bacterium]